MHVPSVKFHSWEISLRLHFITLLSNIKKKTLIITNSKVDLYVIRNSVENSEKLQIATEPN